MARESVSSDSWTALRGECIDSPNPGKTVSDVKLYLSGPAGGTDLYGDAFFLEEGERNLHDIDYDGLWDTWEDTHFGGAGMTGSGANDDYDNDGISNLVEFRAGTDPANAASGFKITVFEKLTDTVRIDWRSEAGKSYRILKADNLSDNNWIPLREQITAAPGENSETLGQSEAGGFYKVMLDE